MAAEAEAKQAERREREEDGVVTATDPGGVATDDAVSTLLEAEALEQADPLASRCLLLLFSTTHTWCPSPESDLVPAVSRARNLSLPSTGHKRSGMGSTTPRPSSSPRQWLPFPPPTPPTVGPPLSTPPLRARAAPRLRGDSAPRCVDRVSYRQPPAFQRVCGRGSGVCPIRTWSGMRTRRPRCRRRR